MNVQRSYRYECPKNDTLKRRQISTWRWTVAGTNRALRCLTHGGRTGLEVSMRPTLVVTAAVLFLLGIGIAKAADPTQLAETGGFLLGNAHRCGVPTDRVEHAGKVIHDLIVAASDNSTEEAAANSRFAQMFMASAFPDQDGDASDPTLQGGGRAIRSPRATSSASPHELTRDRPVLSRFSYYLYH